MLGIGSKTSLELAADVKAAEQAAQEAAETAAKIWTEATDGLAEGKGDVRAEVARIGEARLRASAAQSRVEKLRARLRSTIESEHEAAQTKARKIIEECGAEDRKLQTQMESPAAALVKLISARHGVAAGGAAAIVLHGIAAGHFPMGLGPERGHALQLEAKAGDGFAKMLVDAAEGVDASATNAARREAAQNVLRRTLDVDREVTRLLPPPPVEQPPAKPRKPEPEEANLSSWRIEPGLRDPNDAAVRIG